jgi:hypothetical protein
MRGCFEPYKSTFAQQSSMTTIIGIFDNARDLDKAVNKLARAGFEETVYDESIVAEEASKGEPIAFALGHTPTAFWDNAKPVLPAKPDRGAVVRAFKAHLADYKLPDDVIEGYATTLHHSEFVLVKTQADRADQVRTIMGECGAIRTDRHG